MLNVRDTVAEDLEQLLIFLLPFFFLLSCPTHQRQSVLQRGAYIVIYTRRYTFYATASSQTPVMKLLSVILFNLQSIDTVCTKLHCGKGSVSVVVATMNGCLLTECQVELHDTQYSVSHCQKQL